MTRVLVGKAGDVPVGSLRQVEAAGRTLCLAHAEDDGFYAVDDTCSHEEESLSDGDLFGCEVKCPRHSSTFDLRTGQPSGSPATIPIETYPVEKEGDDIYVVVPGSDR